MYPAVGILGLVFNWIVYPFFKPVSSSVFLFPALLFYYWNKEKVKERDSKSLITLGFLMAFAVFLFVSGAYYQFVLIPRLAG